MSDFLQDLAASRARLQTLHGVVDWHLDLLARIRCDQLIVELVDHEHFNDALEHLNAGKIGTELDVIARDSAIAVSFALQHGATVEEIRSAFTRRPDGSAEAPLGVLFDLLASPKIRGAA